MQPLARHRTSLHQNGRRPTIWTSLIAALVFLTLLIASQTPEVGADAPFVNIFDQSGNYQFAANGVGTRGNPATGEWTGTGVFTIDIPSTATILHARLVWTGRTISQPNGDPTFDNDGVQLTVGANPPVTITADKQFNQTPWFANVQQVHESADILAYVQPGNVTYTVSDHEHGPAPIGNALNYGVGIWLVYEDDSVAPGNVQVYEGQDSFFRFWDPDRGPHTEVRCADFDASTQNRIVEMVHFVSGVDPLGDNTGTGLRSTAFWHQVGSGIKPNLEAEPGIINQPGAIGYEPSDNQYPFQSRGALEWDNFAPDDLVISVPAGSTWACFQIESGDSQDLAGLGNIGYEASGMWNFFAIKLLTPDNPTAVTLASFSATADNERNVTLAWETAAEIDNIGFNLYRTAVNQFISPHKVNAEMIPGSGSSAAAYSHGDVVPAYGMWYYWLEDVDGQGETTRHGPYAIHVSRFNTTFLPLITALSQP